MVTEGGDPPFDVLLEALADIRRRELLVELVQRDPENDALLVADNETASEITDHILAMQHVHLPKLEDFGLIEWDRESGEVTAGPAFGEIRRLLELLIEHEKEWPDDWG